MKNKEKQIEALKVSKPNTQKLPIKDVIPENTLTEEAKNELNKIKEIEKTVDKEKLVSEQMNIRKVLKIFEQ